MISTRLTERHGIEHPVIQAPMALAAGGRLAAAVSRAGGLGMIGGGYGDRDWLTAELAAAGNQPVGCGFITWALRKQPELLEMALDHAPRALFLSFDDPEPFVSTIRERGVPLICQIQTRADAERAVDVGADIVVAQGAEAGGHGEKRATMTLVPEVADLIAAKAPNTLLCAAGGIADGRGMAAALMLGADGVVIGSRFWASDEALVHPNMLDAAMAASGDDTIRSSVADVARKLDWPERFTMRMLRNPFIEQWHDDMPGLLAVAEVEAEKWRVAWQAGDMSVATGIVGEAAGLMQRVEPAATLLTRLIAETEERLAAAPRFTD
ncbi:MAG: nitronate monooxygenase [Pseudomonadota bacterium]